MIVEKTRLTSSPLIQSINSESCWYHESTHVNHSVMVAAELYISLPSFKCWRGTVKTRAALHSQCCCLECAA